MLLRPVGRKIDQPRDAEPSRQRSRDGGFDNIRREESERQDRARRSFREALPLGDEFEPGRLIGQDFLEPASASGDGGEKLSSRLGADRPSAIHRLNQLALAAEWRRPPRNSDRAGSGRTWDAIDKSDLDRSRADEDSIDATFDARFVRELPGTILNMLRRPAWELLAGRGTGAIRFAGSSETGMSVATASITMVSISLAAMREMEPPLPCGLERERRKRNSDSERPS